MTEAQAVVAARYGLDVLCPPDLDIPPPELFPDKAAYVVPQEDGVYHPPEQA